MDSSGSTQRDSQSPSQPLAELPAEAEHELLRTFAAHGLSLNATLREMLNEHHSHRTERRGAGFTQATRHLARLVNRPRELGEHFASPLFANPGAPITSDILRHLLGELALEESRVLAAIIVDLAFPRQAADAPQLPAWPDDLKIGTCPLAEKYFLELAEAFVRRRGLANVLVSPDGAPLLIEKINLGDDHSCISVAPLILNGVALPPGSLFGVHYEGALGVRKNRELPGEVIPISDCSGFRFLRLSTLSISPMHRERAFTTHFQAQVSAGLFAPGETTIEQLHRLALRQI